MDYLKPIFGEGALTFDEFVKKLGENKEIKLANLADGKYVDKQKLDDKVAELSTANKTIADLQTAVKKFDGVDVDKLNQQIADLNEKYTNDTSALKLDSALNMALVGAKAKNPKLAKAALDMSVIKLDGDKLLGFEEQLERLKESDGYLFDSDTKNNNANQNNGGYTGRGNSGAGHGGNNNVDYDKMSDEEYYNKIYAKKE